MGATFFVWSFFKKDTTSTSNDTPNSGYTGGNNQTIITIPSSQNLASSTATQVDIETAFSDLFQNLLAQQVQFSTVVSTSSLAYGDIYRLYVQTITEAKTFYPTLKTFPVEVAKVDLNEDGVEEAIAYVAFPGYCGIAGCPLDVYKKQNGVWVSVFSTVSPGAVGLSNTFNRGYQDLFLLVQNNSAYQTRVIRYTWDGTTYKSGEVVAVWDGNVFKMTK